MTQRTLTLYLGKEDLTDFDEVFTDDARVKIGLPTTQVVDAPEFGDGARLYVFVGQDHPPSWLGQLRHHFDIPGNITTSSAAAVLLFLVSGRLFASPFSHGWMYLDDHRFEGDFGMRVAINALDDSKLKRLERANLGDALRAVAQSPFQRGLNSFGLDDALDLIRKISGRTRDGASANSMTGSRSLKVTGEFGIPDLPDLAIDALDYFVSDAYQQTQFVILDSVRPVADRDLSDDLDEAAAVAIREGEERFELGLPIGFDDQAVSYRFKGPGLRGSHPDLLLHHYTQALGARLPDLTAETLRNHYIVAEFEDQAKPDAKWPLRSALVGSLVWGGERFAINEGEWYRIEQAFKDAIEQSFVELLEQWAVPPEPLRKLYDEDGNGKYEPEVAYNKRFANMNGFVFLDRALIQIPEVERSGFESCDILDIAGKRFLHIKKSSRRSNVLSHFFKQGANSARHFSMFADAWVSLRELVHQRAGAVAAHQLDAVINDGRSWKIEFIIADTPRANGQFNIPFFSKVSLRDEVRMLRAMQYDVGLKFIGLQPDAPAH